MIDSWLKKDLEKILGQHSVAVFIDESGETEFLLRSVNKKYRQYVVNSVIEELHVKYLIERNSSKLEKVLIYTHIKRGNLKFLREYCETNGCLEIKHLQNYIKDKVHQTLNLNINLPKEELIAAAKVSVGKDKTYWMDLSHKGAAEIFDLKKELLPFIHDPDAYAAEKYDAQLREVFYRKVNELLGQDYIPKPPATLAEEVVKSMLDGLACNSCNKVLKAVYQNWLDSVSYMNSFSGYLSKYTLPTNIKIWDLNINHPFRSIDEMWLTEVGKHISDKSKLPNYLVKIKKRSNSKQALTLDICFWSDVIELLEFDSKKIAFLSSFEECVAYYTNHFFKLDTAIRNLYSKFLNNKQILEPFQELYKEHVSIFLDKWFKYFDGYKENQTGTLQSIIDDNSEKTAIIVTDGVAYEVAELVAAKVKKQFKLIKNTILADIPSETENNMSRIYMDNGVIEKIQNKREKYLLGQNANITIDFMRLDEVTEEANSGQFLICTYKDIDDIGEKLQQKALKYFPETIDFFADKINQLLGCGYAKVYLISDHGFVLTGLLSEADKVSVSFEDAIKIAERYIRSKSKENHLGEMFVVKEKCGEYLCFSKTMNPFKSIGTYGFSHGGISPQELITPFFSWEQSESSIASLTVLIDNKNELKSVTGELFQINFRSDKESDDLFSLERKVYLVFFFNKKQINKSDVFTIKRDQLVTKEYTFDGNSEIEVQLLDATTKKQLDKTVIKQNNDRDLGGLF